LAPFTREEVLTLKRLPLLALLALAALWLFPSPARASSLSDCLAHQHVCVTSNGRAIVSQDDQSLLEELIGSDHVYLVIASSGPKRYDDAMRQIIGVLDQHKPEYAVGFLDTDGKHFGAYNRGILPEHGAANIATQVVKEFAGEDDLVAALIDFVTEVHATAIQELAAGAALEDTQGVAPDASPGGAPVDTQPPRDRGGLIGFAVVGVVVVATFLAWILPARRRRQRQLADAKSAAQDDLIALGSAVTELDTDVLVQNQPEAAQEQAAALGCYERGTRALDRARRLGDMRTVGLAIAQGQYHLAAAKALSEGKPRPGRRPPCFFDPRHGMSLRDVVWTPTEGGTARDVPACATCAHQVDDGIQPDMRQIEVAGAPVRYLESRVAPGYWGGYYGYGGGGHELFTGFLLGQALAPHPPAFSLSGFGGGDFGGAGGADAGGDFGGGDLGGGGGFGGGDFGGGGGGGDFGGGGGFS
jgi:hypothetical protein